MRVHANAPFGLKGRVTMVHRTFDQRRSFTDAAAAVGAGDSALSHKPPIAPSTRGTTGWVLHPENHRRDERSGAEQLGDDEQGERETAGRGFAVTVLGLGFDFHLVSVQRVVATLGVTRVA